MSEISGYVLIHSKNESTFKEMCKEFKEGCELEINEDTYSITKVNSEGILDICIYTSEYSDTTNICKYIRKKYKPDILISSFDEEAFIQQKKSTNKKAFASLAQIKPKIGFYLNIEYEKYKEAFELLDSGDVSLTDTFVGIPNYERCFFGNYAPLMEFAVERGYHNLICHYDEDFPYDDEGVHVLHRLIKCGDLNLLKKALKLGANPEGKDGDKNTLLHIIPWRSFSHEIDLDFIELVNELKIYGANFNAKNYSSLSPIFSLANTAVEFSESYNQEIGNMVQVYILNGSSVEGYDDSGAGLLSYFNKHSRVQELLLKENPRLPPYSEDFNTHAYILKRAHIHPNKLPHEYDEYFTMCIKLEFIDFMFDKERVDLLKELTTYQLYRILDAMILSPKASTVIEGLLMHALPILIEYDHYTNDEVLLENCSSLDVAEYYKKHDIVDLYNTLKGQKYKKIKLANPRIGSEFFDYKIEDSQVCV